MIYIKAIRISTKFNNLRIVVDCANGACYKVSPAVFKELGAEVIEFGANPDGFNINHECGGVKNAETCAAITHVSAFFTPT
jgi:phosphoglucosamine mutase